MAQPIQFTEGQDVLVLISDTCSCGTSNLVPARYVGPAGGDIHQVEVLTSIGWLPFKVSPAAIKPAPDPDGADDEADYPEFEMGCGTF
jgi:hypothetical protein